MTTKDLATVSYKEGHGFLSPTAEIIEAYRRAAQPYADRAAEILGRYTHPQALMRSEQ